MQPYRWAGHVETEGDRREVAAFASLHRSVRRRALAGGLGATSLTIVVGLLYGYWFYYGPHCAFACM
jgi:hypothetical protein